MANSNTDPTANRTATQPAGLELAVIAYGIARLDYAELAVHRKTPPSRFTPRIGPLLLKHSDEQTVAALVAMDRAMSAANIANEACGRWAVVSTSSYLGRNASVAVTDKFQAEGPWGVSVHPTPHRSLHSVASTVSLGLQSHGPSIGAGGAPGQEPSALLSAAGMLESGAWDGVWTLFSAWSPELELDFKGQPISESTCLAVALGLVSQPVVTTVGRVRIDIVEGGQTAAAPVGDSHQESVNLTEFLADEGRKRGAWSCSPSPWMRLELDLPLAELPKPHFSIRGAESSRTVVRPAQPAQTRGDATPPV